MPPKETSVDKADHWSIERQIQWIQRIFMNALCHNEQTILIKAARDPELDPELRKAIGVAQERSRIFSLKSSSHGEYSYSI